MLRADHFGDVVWKVARTTACAIKEEALEGYAHAAAESLGRLRGKAGTLGVFLSGLAENSPSRAQR
eukprot:10274638-Alexandrium_andersonii.AAC.1